MIHWATVKSHFVVDDLGDLDAAMVSVTYKRDIKYREERMLSDQAERDGLLYGPGSSRGRSGIIAPL